MTISGIMYTKINLINGTVFTYSAENEYILTSSSMRFTLWWKYGNTDIKRYIDEKVNWIYQNANISIKRIIDDNEIVCTKIKLL